MAGFGVLAIALLIFSGVFYYERPTVLKIAVSGTDAEDYDLMSAAVKVLKRGRHPVRLKLVPTDGVAAASAALDKETVDLAVVRADVAMPANGETVLLLHKDAAVLLAPAGGAVETISDLAGKTIGILSQRLGDRHLLDTALAQYDIMPDSVKVVPLGLGAITEALQAKSVDAVFAVGKIAEGPVALAVKAVAKVGDAPPVFLPIAEADAIAQRIPAYNSFEVVRGAFGGTPPRPAEEFDTLGVTYRMVANSDLSEDVVANLTRFFLSERVALAQIAPDARSIEAPSTDKGAAFPVHPGTAAYIDDDEETFFDRYSDVIYIGAMVLGVLASGATALMGRFGSQGGVKAEDLVAQLLQIFKQVRAAPTVAMLDRLEDEVDDIVTSALDEANLRSLDERRMPSLNMAVEQVRAAIRDRRDSLRRATLMPANDETMLSLEPPSFRTMKTLGDRSSPPE
jgi:TRAP transporter TAXI family solute receptor